MNCTNEWSMSAAAKLLGKQNRKAFSLLNLGNAKYFFFFREMDSTTDNRDKNKAAFCFFCFLSVMYYL